MSHQHPPHTLRVLGASLFWVPTWGTQMAARGLGDSTTRSCCMWAGPVESNEQAIQTVDCGPCRAAVAATLSPEAQLMAPGEAHTPLCSLLQGGRTISCGLLFSDSPTDSRIQRWLLLFSRFFRPVLLLFLFISCRCAVWKPQVS